MKKIYLSLLLIIPLLSSQIIPSFAIENSSYIEERFEDGSYIETTLYNVYSKERASTTKTKTSVYYDNNKKAHWSISVTGTFTYNGNYAKCTNSKATTKTYDSTWKLTNINANKEKNKAIASVIAKQYDSNNTLKRSITKTVTLTCSKTGVLS